MRTKMLAVLVVMTGVIFACSTSDMGPGSPAGNMNENDPGISFDGSTKLPDGILDGTIVRIGPLSIDDFSIKILEETEKLLVSQFNVVMDLIVIDAFDPDVAYILQGSIDTFIMEQEIVKHEYMLGLLKKISGNFVINKIVSLEKAGGLAAILLGGQQCETDEECEEHFPPHPTYVLKCIDGRCKYVAP
ncbi:hypothetical protein ACFL5L_06305 [candidate division KSB1 bacterium]